MLEPMAALEIDTPEITDTSSLIDGSETTTSGESFALFIRDNLERRAELDLDTPDFTDKSSVGSVSLELFFFLKLSFGNDGGDMVGGDGMLSFGIFSL
jgi:hypothetical protein